MGLIQWPQEKLETILVQMFGGTNKEHNGIFDIGLLSSARYQEVLANSDTHCYVTLMCQPEINNYWLFKQKILLFCGWQNLNNKRIVSKQ